GACAIVRQKNEDGVVQASEPVKLIDQPANLGIGMIEKRRIGFLQALTQTAEVGAERSPRSHPGVKRSETGAVWDHPQCLLPFETFGPDRVPADTVAAAVLVDEPPRNMVRPMTRAKCKIEKRGSLWRGSRVVAQIGNRVVHEIAAEVIFAARSDPNRAIVPVEFRIPLIGQGAVKSVPAGKSAD